MAKVLIPPPRVPLVDARGVIQPAWWQFFAQAIQGVADAPGQSIDAASIAKWDVAYSWGNHAGAGYLTDEAEPAFTASPAAGISSGNIANWNAAYGWGNHALAGYLTSAPAEADPVWLAFKAAGGTIGGPLSHGDLTVNGTAPLKKILTNMVTLNHPSIAAGASASLTVNVPGALLPDSVICHGANVASQVENGLIQTASVTAADTVTVRLYNTTAAAIDPATRWYRVTVLQF